MNHPRQNIHIATRLKPSTSPHTIPISIESNFITIAQDNTSKEFVFDQIFQAQTSQEELYNSIGFGLVERVVEGFHTTILCYGQTGSGKTYTIFGDPDNYGIIPRASKHLLDIRDSDQMKFILRVSCFEIYNEQIRDLLDEGLKKQIKQSKQGVYVKDIAKILIKTYDDFRDVLNIVEGMRSTHETAMNKQSSRSHCILTFYLEIMEQINGQEIYKQGRMYCVDLAGSERQKKTNSIGMRLRQANSINKNLVVLRNVIHALIENKDYIPYRDSKLTRLLQDSFGGGTKTRLIANISTDLDNINQSISTLRYAAVASKVSNCPIIHYDAKDLLIKQYIQQINRLKHQQLNHTLGGNTNPDTISSINNRQKKQKDQLLAERHQISQALQQEQQANLVLKNRIEQLSKLINPNPHLPPLQKSKFNLYRKRQLKSLIEKQSILQKSKQMILQAETQFQNQFENQNLQTIDIIVLKQKYQNLKRRYFNLKDELQRVTQDYKQDKDLYMSKTLDLQKDNQFYKTVISKYITTPQLNYIRSNSIHLPNNSFNLPQFNIVRNGVQFPNKSSTYPSQTFSNNYSNKQMFLNEIKQERKTVSNQYSNQHQYYNNTKQFMGEYNADLYRDKSRSVSRKRRFQPLKSPKNMKTSTFPQLQPKVSKSKFGILDSNN